MERRRVVVALCALVASATWAAPGAEAVPKLVDALGGSRSFKVRVQAASLLGRIKDPRAFQALVRAAVDDPHPAVRAVAVRVLARNRMESDQARLAVTRALTDRDPGVRRQAAISMAELQRASAAAAPGSGPVVVAVGGIGDRTGRASKAFRERVRSEIRGLIARESRVRLAELGSPGVGYVVDASIAKLNFAPTAMDMEAVVAIELVVSRPPRGIITVASGEAIVMKPKRHFRANLRESMELDALEAAVRSAHENLSQFLATAR
jgi:hypothetical protein